MLVIQQRAFHLPCLRIGSASALAETYHNSWVVWAIYDESAASCSIMN